MLENKYKLNFFVLLKKRTIDKMNIMVKLAHFFKFSQSVNNHCTWTLVEVLSNNCHSVINKIWLILYSFKFCSIIGTYF